MAPLTSENSSYTVTFEGPQIRCQTLSVVNTTNTSSTLSDLIAYKASWPYLGLVDDEVVMKLSYINPMGYFPIQKQILDSCSSANACNYTLDPPWNTSYTAVLEQHTIQCKGFNTVHRTSIDYVRGVQNITYTTETEEELHFRLLDDFRWNSTERYELPNDTQEYKDWVKQLPVWAYKVNSQAILDAVGKNLEYQWAIQVSRDNTDDVAVGTYQLPNGTEVELGALSETFWGDTMKNSKPGSHPTQAFLILCYI